MKRQWNWMIWVGFVVAVAGLFSYGFFVRFPITRARHAEFLIDSSRIVRWVNLIENIAVRAQPGQVLTALNQIEPGGR
jgi:hypothetical protein